MTFEIGEEHFLLDGEPHRVLSGALHYFRVHPEQWADRIHKAKLMGLNTIETYVAWNAHEPRKGEWDATGWNDLGRFLDLIAAEGMHAIVRPGPYICAEWHNGGLPTWLTAMPGVGLRRSEPSYLHEVETYLQRVYDIVAPRQIDVGGPVVLVQIENEYGAYGNDTAYLERLVEVTREAGITVPLTTIDQPTDQMLSDGSVDGVHLTGSFGSRADERLATLRRHQPTGPLMCAEFWDGWFDWWGAFHHTTSVEDAARELDALLAAGASVNFYMVHGGTNFGLTNGANHKGRYLPIATSYDYDAPLDEAGNPTPKFFAFRDVISKYADVPAETPALAVPAPELEVPLSVVAPDAWLPPVSPERHTTPPTFDALQHLSALVAYETELPRASAPRLLEFEDVRDFAWLSIDGVPFGTLSRTLHETSIVVPAGTRLRVLVEEQGRVNYAERIGEEKGIIGTPLLDGAPLEGWTATPIDVAEAGIAIGPALTGAPGAGGAALAAADASAPLAHPETPLGLTGLRGEFELEAPSDLYLDTAKWGKGYALVNGFLLGRYWRSGPQQTLYVPGSVLRAGVNTVAIVELEVTASPVARFVAQATLGPLEE
ncbi:beta-galactosidase [Pseudoclavibacter sp. RFBJ3]|uniref:glycoside hydrolase family 35 protein n=1 Tax=unclassified Pseudoclavibacter TaxID=2615177 RepID=UPI000CE884DD|nr:MULTISPECIES: beta-galactosidase family protein [unclassified Pseudoclavibacter]PPF81966.1 beta-galactosidase [Pseudoclavibacter sp. RFBJ5]PPF95464.1 beta-galactosidase [Pseudoclavibacter sp. RFBJ3]PPF95940.1 beta-galactosidase [Pseudoclavibacter sp. RFBH5]PPG21232.1 beta-galactosidase [Pseudoclavibacter sp. RFBI4]